MTAPILGIADGHLAEVHVAGYAASRGEVRVTDVVGDHTIGAETPGERAD